jgi:cell division ATPase FtsA
MSSDNYSLVFNIGSGSVTGSVIRFTEKPGVDVLYYSQEIIPIQKEVSASKHLELMKASLTSLVVKIPQKGWKIKNVYYIFSSPWSTSQTKTIRLKENKSFRLSESYLKRVIDEAQKKSNITTEGKIIEQKIIQIKTNGYIVNEFKNELVKDAEISLFYTVVPENILKEIEGIVNKSFVVKNTWCHSVSLSIFSVVRDLFPQYEDFIYLDISEEMTDISVVREGVIMSNISLPFGRNEFVRELAEKLKVTEIIADSMIKMNSLKSHDQLAVLAFTSALNEIVKNWSDQISQAFDNFKTKLYLPNTIFFVATNDLTTLLSNKFKEENFEIILLEAKKINSPVKIDDIIFKISLTFLDKLYKI